MQFDVVDEAKQTTAGRGMQVTGAVVLRHHFGVSGRTQLLFECAHSRVGVLHRPAPQCAVRCAWAWSELPVVKSEVRRDGTDEMKQAEEPGQGDRNERGHGRRGWRGLAIMLAIDQIRVTVLRAPQALLTRLNAVEGMHVGQRRLVLLFSQLGDFDSLEYAQALVRVLPQLAQAEIRLLAIGIGDQDSADRFCSFTGFPRSSLQVETDNRLHVELGLYQGLQLPGGPWPSLLLMCAGIGSPGTLAEVCRGYTGDRSAPQRFNNPLFRLAGGEGFQRPFELASVRLQNMVEVLGRWRTYVPCDDFITQRGGTYLLETDDSMLYEHRDRGILGFSSTMARPLQFLEPFGVVS